jgi:hypothetical protein
MTEKMDFVEKLGPFRKSAFYALVFTGVVIAIVLFILLPYNHSLKKTDLEILSLKDKLARQELQYPLYQRLLKEIQKPGRDHIEPEAQEKLKKEDISQVSSMIRNLAETNHLNHGKSDPDINSMTGNKGLIFVKVEVEGLFEDFRNFMVGLNEIPYLQDIEEIKIHSVETNRRYELKIWLAVE